MVHATAAEYVVHDLKAWADLLPYEEDTRGGRARRGRSALAALKPVSPDVLCERFLRKDCAPAVDIAAIEAVPTARDMERDRVVKEDRVVDREPDVNARDCNRQQQQQQQRVCRLSAHHSLSQCLNSSGTGR